MDNGTLTKIRNFKIDTFEVECGEQLENINICFETWGTLNERADNVILIEHALTGTTHAAGHENGSRGWWDILIGPGKAFDPDKHFIICSNTLGGCSGSSGPSSIDPKTGRPFGLKFPIITIRDMVRAQKLLIDHLGIRKLLTISGGSMGGMQAMEWAVLFPEKVTSIIPIAAPGRAYPQSIAFRKAQRKAIMLDPLWRDGNYYGHSVPANGIETARIMGFISYRTEREFANRFGRRFADGHYFDLHGRFEVEEYLEYHGRKLASWFDANSYLYLSKAMDLHDLGYGCDSFEEGVQRIEAATLMIGFDSDILFPSRQQKEVADLLSLTNPFVHFEELNTQFGHDAFLIEEEQLNQTINSFLNTLNLPIQKEVEIR